MQERSGSRSTASVFGHPVHPMLVPFPITFLIAALVSDSAYAATKDKFWSRASLWLTGGGVAGGLASAGTGLTDFVTIRKARVWPDGWVHLLGNVMVMALATASFVIRLTRRDRAVVPLGLTLQSAIGLILLVTGWYGGELAYRHRIGVMPRPEMLEELEEKVA